MLPEDCVTALRQCFPELGVRRVERLGAGFDFWSFVSPQGQVFRFARHAAAGASLQATAAVLAQIAPRLPLPVPAYAWRGAYAGRPFAGYPFLQGRLVAQVEGLPPGAAVELGGFLACLHRAPLDDALCDPLRALGRGTGSVQLWLESAPRQLAPHLDAVQRRRLEAACAVVAAQQAARAEPEVLCHGDLGLENLLATADGARLCGVIDFDDLLIADPAFDLRRLCRRLPPPLFAALVVAYGGSAALASRAAAFAALCPIEEALDWLEAGEPRRAAATARAWSVGGATP